MSTIHPIIDDALTQLRADLLRRALGETSRLSEAVCLAERSWAFVTGRPAAYAAEAKEEQDEATIPTSAGRRGTGRAWTPDEVRELHKLVSDEDLTTSELADRFARSPGAMTQKIIAEFGCGLNEARRKLRGQRQPSAPDVAFQATARPGAADGAPLPDLTGLAPSVVKGVRALAAAGVTVKRDGDGWSLDDGARLTEAAMLSVASRRGKWGVADA